MKRMGALLGITSLVVLSFAYFVGVKFSLILSAIAFVLFVLSFIVKKYRKNYYIKLVLGVVVFSALFFAIFTNSIINQLYIIILMKKQQYQEL